MSLRLRGWLYLTCAGMLYLGPMLAGLAGYGAAVIPVFTALFLLWLVVLRPGIWPAGAGWHSGVVLATLLGRALGQLLLVGFCFAIGRGVGALLDSQPPLPLGLVLGLSFVAIPLARLLGNPAAAAEIDRVLDTAIDRIEAITPPDPAAALAQARAAITPLGQLADDASIGRVGVTLGGISASHDPDALLLALLDPPAPGPGRALRLALVLHATDGRQIERMACDAPTRALAALPDDPDLIAIFARRLTQALEQDGDLWGQCPGPALLEARIATLAGTEAEAPLRALLAATVKATP